MGHGEDRLTSRDWPRILAWPRRTRAATLDARGHRGHDLGPRPKGLSTGYIRTALQHVSSLSLCSISSVTLDS